MGASYFLKSVMKNGKFAFFVFFICHQLNAAVEERTIASQPQEIKTVPCCEGFDKHFFFEGQYLCWQANLSGLELSFGSSSLIQGTTDGISYMNSKEFNIDPSFEWSSGVRLGFGGYFPSSNWSLSAFWTHFKDKGSRSIDGNTGSCRVSLEQLDVAAAFACTWPSIIVEPFLGVRAAEVNLSVKSQVITNIEIAPDTTALGTVNFDDHQDFKGIGPLFGLDAHWTAVGGFGLYGDAAFSVLYGNYKVSFNDSNFFSAPLSSESSSRINQHLHRFIVNMDLALGVFWKACICNKAATTLALGYEFHDYFNISNLGPSKGDLSFNGVVASFEIAF